MSKVLKGRGKWREGAGGDWGGIAVAGEVAVASRNASVIAIAGAVPDLALLLLGRPVGVPLIPGASRRTRTEWCNVPPTNYLADRLFCHLCDANSKVLNADGDDFSLGNSQLAAAEAISFEVKGEVRGLHRRRAYRARKI